MRTAVVTGGNRGIGYAVCEALVGKGFRTVAVVRNGGAPPGVEVVRGDLANRRTVDTLASALRDTCDAIDVLVHNAGIWPTRLRHNDDGIEESFAVNHLAPFQLNLALADRVRRVVQVSAGLYVKGRVDLERTPYGRDFHRMRTYCDTKRANLLLVPLFARRWQDAGVTIDAVHPGVIRTDLGDPGGVLGAVLRVVKRRWASPAEGAVPIVRLADDTGSGRYFDVDTEGALPDGPAQALWDQARELTGAG
ncbi:SDR family NAD(P)-dependent oxidoreductase [Actinophytocola sp. NPDC049390]|uniref:SDR family NAD(P)-dependent oxidoreductase n=1 Tax=Actinophytocola sp. NPDC049390 TaxID=3363894 RepID=UPI0037ACAA79